MNKKQQEKKKQIRKLKSKYRVYKRREQILKKRKEEEEVQKQIKAQEPKMIPYKNNYLKHNLEYLRHLYQRYMQEETNKNKILTILAPSVDKSLLSYEEIASIISLPDRSNYVIVGQIFRSDNYIRLWKGDLNYVDCNLNYFGDINFENFSVTQGGKSIQVGEQNFPVDDIFSKISNKTLD